MSTEPIGISISSFVFHANADNNNEKACPICLDDFEEGEKLAGHENHRFHNNCLESALRIRAICPLCRGPFDVPQATPAPALQQRPLTIEELTAYRSQLADLSRSLQRVARGIQMLASGLHMTVALNGLGSGHLPITQERRFEFFDFESPLGRGLYDENQIQAFDWESPIGRGLQNGVNEERFDWENPFNRGPEAPRPFSSRVSHDRLPDTVWPHPPRGPDSSKSFF